MVTNSKLKLWSFILMIYGLCFACRILEYLVLRTDQTVWGEAFVHKLAGIAILFWAAKSCGFSLRQLGFSKRGIGKNLLRGLIFSLAVFALAYGAEIAALTGRGKFQRLEIYVSIFNVDKNIEREAAPIFFLLCIAGNIINVIMEEGIFRGLFQRLLEEKYRFIMAAVLPSILFGLWHVMAPIRSLIDGETTLAQTVVQTIVYVTASALVGFTFALMTKLTGSLYMAMMAHFINNSSVNLLHVLSESGSDELMAVRVAVAQSLSLLLVLVWYSHIQKRHRKEVKIT